MDLAHFIVYFNTTSRKNIYKNKNCNVGMCGFYSLLWCHKKPIQTIKHWQAYLITQSYNTNLPHLHSACDLNIYCYYNFNVKKTLCFKSRIIRMGWTIYYCVWMEILFRCKIKTTQSILHTLCNNLHMHTGGSGKYTCELTTITQQKYIDELKLLFHCGTMWISQRIHRLYLLLDLHRRN